MDPKTMWGAGNYAAVAERISEVGELVVERAATEPGMELLDVACGAGNATIPAAREGARVTGLDFSADLLAVARERAADAMVEVDWVEGDAQELPVRRRQLRPGDLHLRAHVRPRPQAHRRRDEARVPPGRDDRGRVLGAGRLDRADVPRDGRVGAAAPGGEPPILWGTEQHIRELLGDGEFERHEIEWTDESVESYARFMLESFGPLLNAREALGERENELDEGFRAFLASENLADDGTLRFKGEYLLAVVPR